jgi:hypothetical protein
MPPAATMTANRHTVARAATWTAVVVHITAVALLVTAGVGSDGPPRLDPLRPEPIAIQYSAPAILAAMAVRDRRPLLLVAGIATVVLALVPFSLHSLVLGPLGVVYLLAYMRLRPGGGGGYRTIGAAVACPLLLVGAMLALVLHNHPVCYSKLRSGRSGYRPQPTRGSPVRRHHP